MHLLGKAGYNNERPRGQSPLSSKRDVGQLSTLCGNSVLCTPDLTVVSDEAIRTACAFYSGETIVARIPGPCSPVCWLENWWRARLLYQVLPLVLQPLANRTGHLCSGESAADGVEAALRENQTSGSSLNVCFRLKN